MVEWFMLISSVILAVITGVYAWQTRKVVTINHAMLNISNTPEIQVFLIPRRETIDMSTIDLCIYNIGTGFAFDLKFSGNFSSFHPSYGTHTLAECGIIRNGISHLGPDKKYQRPMYKLNGHNFVNLPNEILTMNVTYTGGTGRIHHRTFRLNFNHVDSYSRSVDPSIESIVVSLLSIDNNLSKIKDSINPNQ